MFTDVCIPHVLAMVDCLRFRRELAAKKIEIAFMNLTKINFNGSTAYLVNAKSKQKVFDLLDAATELNIPYDFYLRGLAHISALQVFAVFPFVTSLSEFSDMSQIKMAGINRGQLAWNMFRKMIWNERNLADCKSGLEFLKSTLSDNDMNEFSRSCDVARRRIEGVWDAILFDVRQGGLDQGNAAGCRRLSLVRPIQFTQRDAAIFECFGIVGPQDERAIEARQRFIKSLQFVERAAAIVECLGKVRPQGECAIIARQRLVMPFQFLQGIAAVVQHLGVVGLHGKRAIIGRQRVVKPA